MAQTPDVQSIEPEALPPGEQTREWVFERLGQTLQNDFTVESYEDAVGELRQAGWPLERMLARLAQENTGIADGSVAQNATLALGLEGSREAEYELWRLREDPQLGALAVAQWLELNVPGEGQGIMQTEERKLRELFWNAERRDAVVAFGRRVGGESALAMASDWIRGARGRHWDGDTVAGLGEVLRSVGSAGTRLALLELERGEIPREQWIEELVRMDDAREEAQYWVGQGLERGARAAALDLMAALPDEQWVPWVLEWAEDRRLARLSLLVLAEQPGRSALHGLLLLHDHPWTDGETWLAAWRQAVAADPARVEVLAQNIPGDQLRDLARALLLCEAEGVAHGMLALLVRDQIGESLTLQLFEALAGSESTECGETLAALALEWPPMDKAEASACLLALGRLTGEELLRGVLEERYGLRAGKRMDAILELARGEGRESWEESQYLMERRLPQARKSKRGMRNGNPETVE